MNATQITTRERPAGTMVPLGLSRAAAIAAMLAGLCVGLAAIAHSLQPIGCIAEECAVRTMRTSTTLVAVLAAAGTVFIVLTFAGVVLLARRRSQSTGPARTGVLLLAVGVSVLLFAGAIQALRPHDDMPWMPLLVLPGMLTVIGGLIVSAVFWAASGLLPRWLGVLLGVSAGVLVVANEQTAAVLLALPLALTLVIAGVTLWRSPDDDPRASAGAVSGYLMAVTAEAARTRSENVGDRPTAVPKRRNLRVPQPELFDVALVLAIAVGHLLVLPDGPLATGELWPTVGYSLLALMPLLWRTHAPVLALTLAMGVQLVLLLAVPGFATATDGFGMLAPLVALGAVAARRPIWLSAVALVTTYLFMAATIAIIISEGPYPDSGTWALFISAVTCCLAWGLGLLAHRVHRRLDALAREHESVTEAVQSERRTIATELNGIIRQSVLGMLRSAATARHAIHADRERASAAFTAIESTGVEAMHELRRLLHLLHDEAGLTPHAAERPTRPADPARTETTLRRRLVSVNRWDVVVTAAVIIATVAFTMTSFPWPTRTSASVFLALALLALLWRRAFPATVFVWIVAAQMAAVLLFRRGDFIYDSWTTVPSVLVALAAVAAASPLRISVPALVIGSGYLSLMAFEYPEVLASNLVTTQVLVIAVWVGGLLAGRRGREIRRLETERVDARQAVEREHARLAYDLHDVIGHSITIMVLQAAGARRILEQDPERAARSLTPIENAGAQALSELDALVRVLDARTPVFSAPRPLYGLEDLDDLIERTRPEVRDIRMVVTGHPASLEPSVDLAAYLVVRQALGNAAKHAGRDTGIAITVAWTDDVLRIEVTNTCAPVEEPLTDLSGGFGLIGLRERVSVAGGDLEWSRDDREFRVVATFPLARTAVLA